MGVLLKQHYGTTQFVVIKSSHARVICWQSKFG